MAHPGHHELSERGVELAVPERQPLCAPDAHVRAGHPSSAPVDARLGRVNRCHRVRTQHRRQRLGQRAGAATDVERSLSALDSGDADQRARELGAVPADVMVVGIAGGVVSLEAGVGHRRPGYGIFRLRRSPHASSIPGLDNKVQFDFLRFDNVGL
jgi:hypothetical protein